MNEFQALNHTQWECKYHVIFIPKCRRKVLYGGLLRFSGTDSSLATVRKTVGLGTGLPERSISCFGTP